MESKQIEAVADATKATMETLGKAIDIVAGYSKILEGPFRSFVGIYDDRIQYRRWKNQYLMLAEAQEVMQQKRIDSFTRDIPLKFGVKLLEYASLEEGEELRRIWARLLVNAGDASSPMGDLRTTYVEMLKDLNAFDVKVFSTIAKLSMSDLPQPHPPLIETWHLPKDARVHTTLSGEPQLASVEVAESLGNLARAGCIAPTYGFGGMPMYNLVAVTPLGIGLYRACTS